MLILANLCNTQYYLSSVVTLLIFHLWFSRSVFGSSVGPKQVSAGDTLQYYEGIQVRGKPTLITPTPPQLPASPILKAQLSAPTPTKKETKSKVGVALFV